MKSITIAVLLVVLVAVVFSAPMRSNTGNQQSQEFGSPPDNNQFERAGQSGSNKQSGCNSQSKGTDRSNNNGQFQRPSQSGNKEHLPEFVLPAGNSQSKGMDHSDNNGRFEVTGHPADFGAFHGFKPFGDHEMEGTDDPHSRFHFATGMPLKGVHHLSEDVTQQPGFFNRLIFGNRNQQGRVGSQHP